MADVAEIKTVIKAEMTDFLTKMKAAQTESDRFKGSMARLTGSLKSGLGAVGVGLGAGAIIAGLKSVTGATLTFAGEIQDAVDLTGSSAENLQALRFAAEESGIGFDKLTGQLAKFRKLLVESKTDIESYRKLQELGVTIDTEDPTKGLEQLARQFSGTADEGVKFAKVAELLGEKAAKLVPLLKAMGTDGLAGLKNKYGGTIISDEDIRRFDELGDKWDALKKKMILGLGEGIVKSITDSISDGRISSAVKQEVSKLKGENPKPEYSAKDVYIPGITDRSKSYDRAVMDLYKDGQRADSITFDKETADTAKIREGLAGIETMARELGENVTGQLEAGIATAFTQVDINDKAAVDELRDKIKGEIASNLEVAYRSASQEMSLAFPDIRDELVSGQLTPMNPLAGVSKVDTSVAAVKIIDAYINKIKGSLNATNTQSAKDNYNAQKEKSLGLEGQLAKLQREKEEIAGKNPKKQSQEQYYEKQTLLLQIEEQIASVEEKITKEKEKQAAEQDKINEDNLKAVEEVLKINQELFDLEEDRAKRIVESEAAKRGVGSWENPNVDRFQEMGLVVGGQTSSSNIIATYQGRVAVATEKANEYLKDINKKIEKVGTWGK